MNEKDKIRRKEAIYRRLFTKRYRSASVVDNMKRDGEMNNLFNLNNKANDAHYAHPQQE